MGQDGLGDDSDKLFDSAFCNFAVHYFWENEESTAAFISNISSLLRVGGKVVVTFMRGDRVRSKIPLTIVSSSGAVEFNIEPVEGEGGSKIKVFIASIGKAHDEYLVDFDDCEADSLATACR